jgi:mono/diheme cytochrome c family protein
MLTTAPLAAAAAAAAAASLLCVAAAVAVGRDSAGTSIKVTMTDTKITLSKKTASVGRVTFLLQNRGKLVHNFRVGGTTSKPLAAGKKGRLVVVFKAAKSWAYLSTLPHGKTKGLNGVFKVTGAVPSSAGNARAGAAVFATAGCMGCHTLEAAGAEGTIGPNLDQLKPAYATIVSTVTNGKGSMPPFRSTLTVTQIQNVAAYVYASTH